MALIRGQLPLSGEFVLLDTVLIGGLNTHGQVVKLALGDEGVVQLLKPGQQSAAESVSVVLAVGSLVGLGAGGSSGNLIVGSVKLVDAAGVQVRQTGPTDGTFSSVPATVAAGGATIANSNTSRLGLMLWNDVNTDLLLAIGNFTPTTTTFSAKVPAGGMFELPLMRGGVYTGIVKGLWVGTPTGSARVTEFT